MHDAPPPRAGATGGASCTRRPIRRTAAAPSRPARPARTRRPPRRPRRPAARWRSPAPGRAEAPGQAAPPRSTAAAASRFAATVGAASDRIDAEVDAAAPSDRTPFTAAFATVAASTASGSKSTRRHRRPARAAPRRWPSTPEPQPRSRNAPRAGNELEHQLQAQPRGRVGPGPERLPGVDDQTRPRTRGSSHGGRTASRSPQHQRPVKRAPAHIPVVGHLGRPNLDQGRTGTPRSDREAPAARRARRTPRTRRPHRRASTSSTPDGASSSSSASTNSASSRRTRTASRSNRSCQWPPKARRSLPNTPSSVRRLCVVSESASFSNSSLCSRLR